MNPEKMQGVCPMAITDSYSNKILAYTRKKLVQKYPDGKLKRAFHAKTIGVVKAKFIIKDNLPDFLKVGLFTEPKTYDAWIRFTNGNATVNDDIKKQARGMAIKVINLEGFQHLDKDKQGIQDIILFTSRTFVPGTSHLQFQGVKTAITTGIEQKIHALPIVLSSIRASLTFLKSLVVTPNILEEMYYSGSPYSFGENRAIKWHARPLKTITSVLPKDPADDFLRERLIKDLSEEAKVKISFALYVQFHENEKTEPIDDSGVEWKTPFHRVATITIPKQNIDTAEMKQKDLDLGFSPGFSITEHAPLGSVNALRKIAYKQLAMERIAHP